LAASGEQISGTAKGGFKIKSKVIVLLTDGVNNQGDMQPADAARLAADWGIKIYSIGIGSNINKGIFDMLGGSLPLPTQVLIMISNVLRKWFIFGFIGLTVLIIVMARFAKTDKGKMFFDRITLKLPVFGDLVRKVSVAKFSRTLSTLIKSGVPILSSLDIVAKTTGNKIVEAAIAKSKKAVREGRNLAQPFSESSVFPPMVVRMISVGEQAGELEKMLSKIADFYDEQVDAAVAGLTSIIEPMIILFLGVVVGGIVLSIFMPIFKITEIIGG